MPDLTENFFESYCNLIELIILYVLGTVYYKISYCASDILTCTPALVSMVGGDEEIYGFTLR